MYLVLLFVQVYQAHQYLHSGNMTRMLCLCLSKDCYVTYMLNEFGDDDLWY